MFQHAEAPIGGIIPGSYRVRCHLQSSELTFDYTEPFNVMLMVVLQGYMHPAVSSSIALLRALDVLQYRSLLSGRPKLHLKCHPNPPLSLY